MRFSSAKYLGLALLMSAGTALYAQDNSGLTGVVTDASGAVIPGATVVLSNPSNGLSFTAKTDKSGSYRFPQVPAGRGYMETVTAPGFSSYTTKDMYLAVGVSRTQNAKLNAGENTSIEVSAGNQDVTLNTTDAQVGNNIDPKAINELPVFNRSSISALLYVQPGVTTTGSVTGARTDQTQLTIDGMDVNDLSTGQTFFSTIASPVDSIQEIRGSVAGLNASASAGGGGNFQLVTKSGTNKFHGNINEYHRDPGTSANTYFNGFTYPTPTAKQHLVENQFGGAIGGPILRDKLFFFFDFNNDRTATKASTTRTVPLDTFRAGNIGYVNNTAGCPINSRANVNAGCISYLTQAQTKALDPKGIGLSPALLAYINSRYPHVNDFTGGDGINTGTYRFRQNTGSVLYNYVGRVDYNLTPTQKLFIRGTYQRRDGVQAFNQFDTDPGTVYPNRNRSYGYVIGHTWSIGQNKVNQFYFGDTINVLSFPVTFFPTGNNSYSFGPLDAPNGSLSAQGRRVPIPMLRDDYTWTKGGHTVQLGGTFKWIKTHSNLTNDYNFVGIGLGGLTASLDSSPQLRPADLSTNTTNITSYDSVFTFGLGRVASLSRNYNYDAAGNALAPGTGSQRAYRSYQTELYIADTWKATPELTLSYGLRWQLFTTPYEVGGRQTNQNFGFDDYFQRRVAQSLAGTTGNTAVPYISYTLGGKANNAAPAFNQSYKDFAPHFAFAYNPSAARNTVINGSFAVQYDRTVYNALNFIQDQLSYFFANSQSVSYGNATAATALANDPRYGDTLTPPPPVVIPRNVPYVPYVDASGPNGTINSQANYAIDPNFKSPYNLTFNLGLQQKLKGDFVFSGNYVGRLGRRLIGQADASQLVDFKDTASGQMMGEAFRNLSLYIRNNPASTTSAAGRATIPTQLWFEDQVLGAPAGYTKTAYVAAALKSLVTIGDFADTIQALYANGLLRANVGLPPQFSINSYITNKGYSIYHGGLFTLTKNMSHGLQFQLNYTYSHSMDNVSAVANSIGFSSGLGQICDATRPAACYANSDFDVKHSFNGEFVYELPFGRGRQFGGHVNRVTDLLLGGWNISGLPTWRSGVAWTATTNAYLAGYANNAAPVFIGRQSQLKRNLHKNAAGQLIMFDNAVQTNPTDHGTGAQSIFRNPAGFEYGSRNNLRGPSAFFMEAGVSKRFQIVPDRVALQLRGDAFNVFNHPVFNTPSSTNINGGAFGRITTQLVPASETNGGSRILQVSGRIEF